MSSLKTRTVSGAKWALAARLFRSVAGIVTMAVLSRILNADEFGVMALILFMTMFAQILADFGMRIALVQTKDLQDGDADTVFWTNLTMGCAIAIAVWLGAEQISALFGAPLLAEPLRAVSPVYFLFALQGVSMSMLERRLEFGRIAQAEVIGGLLGMIAVVALALAGWRLGAVVVQQLVYTGVGMALVMRAAGWRPRLRYSLPSLRRLFSYGGYATLTNISEFTASYADRPLMGRGLSAADLGHFSVANQVIAAPLLILMQMVRKVMFPVLSSLQDDDARLRRLHLNAEHALMTVMAPICLGVAALATPFINLLLGEGWDAVVPVLILLSMRSLLNPINNLNSVLFVAKGQVRFQFRWSLMSTALSIGALIAGMPYGLMAALGARLAMLLVLTPIYTRLALRLIDQSWKDLAGALAPSLLCAGAMHVVVRLADAAAVGAGAGDILRLAVGVPLGAVVYIALLLLVDRARCLELLRTVRNRRAG